MQAFTTKYIIVTLLSTFFILKGSCYPVNPINREIKPMPLGEMDGFPGMPNFAIPNIPIPNMPPNPYANFMPELPSPFKNNLTPFNPQSQTQHGQHSLDSNFGSFNLGPTDFSRINNNVIPRKPPGSHLVTSACRG